MKSKGPVVRNYGGTYQLRIETAEDLKAVLGLDDARWVATSAPINGINCDPVFLKYADTDNNDRIRTDEIRNAISWMFEMLSDTDCLPASDTLPLEAIETSHAAGKMLRAGAEQILRNLGRADAGEIALADVRDQQKILANAAANGDGVIPAEACSGQIAEFVKDILDTVGGTPDASGETGIGAEQLDGFLKDAAAYLEWQAAGKIPSDKKKSDIMVLGKDTPAAFDSLSAVRQKLDEYFSLCKLVRFDPNLKSAVGFSEEDIKHLDTSDMQAVETEVKKVPIAPVGGEDVLDFNGTINPYCAQAVADFRGKTAVPVLGKIEKLSGKEWEDIKAAFEPYRTWMGNKKGAAVEKLGEEKLRRYLGSDFGDRVRALIDADASVADEVAETAKIEKLILFRKWLIELCNNMVSMPRLYDPETKALFQMGTLVMDGRQFEFNVKVPDRAQHKKIASLSGIFLMYVEVIGKGGADEKFEVATPVTAGDTGNLAENKRGIFFTTDGREWDARVVDIIRKPISLCEAVKAPFVTISASIGRQIEKITGARSAALDTGIQKAIQQKPAAAPGGSGAMMGTLMGGGLAISALGASFAFITKTLVDVKLIQVLFVLIAGACAIFGPIIIMGIIRLRRRDMATILEASGWAVNARLRITGSLGRLLTFRPSFPPDAVKERVNLVEQLARKAGRRRNSLKWVLGFVFAAVLGSVLGCLLRGLL